ncbi:MAG: dTDP-4-dehydrorhamnose reductase [Anaeroplasmataceae bacterium]|nr:dTDP-4-dehydrorhamnose reductase [Anaeroplasmataceae bacterium]
MHKNLRILVTGANGQLGFDCLRELNKRGYQDVRGIDIEDLDITNQMSVEAYIKAYNPDVVIHNAAWTAVDKAEECPSKVYEVNASGTQYIAKACKKTHATMVYISTDYVFDGMGDTPFEVNDSRNGLSVYGKTKSQGEDFVIAELENYFIVRISWVFGVHGNNFVKTMLKLANQGKTEISVVNDQIGSVTYTYDLARLLCDMIETKKYGVYHAANEGYLSWYDFAVEIFKQANKKMIVNSVTTEEYRRKNPQQANRPLNSRLSKRALIEAGFQALPDWKDALQRFLKEMKSYE